MKPKSLFGAVAALSLSAALATPASAAQFVETTTASFGTFNGIDYVIHTGRFEGSTALGEFRVPYQIVAPADPTEGERTLLMEPPHWVFGPAGRDAVLGRAFLFGKGIRYAAVGFGLNGFNILDNLAGDLIIAGNPVVPPVFPNLAGLVDEEIIVQFTAALEGDPAASALIGPIDRRYAYGVSQTSAVLQEIQFGPFGVGLFDLWLHHDTLWQPYFETAGPFDNLPGGDEPPAPFDPPSDIGRVMFVASEGDQIISNSEFLRSAAGLPDYRLYEVAGSPHLVTAANPLNHNTVMRAVFERGDEWVRLGLTPPASRLMAEDSGGGPDPVYGFPTGIARDSDLNALGGVRLPDLEVGRAQYIASDFSTGLIPGIEGKSVDLTCPADGTQRFEEHGDYVNAFVAQANALVADGFLLPDTAEALKEQAAESDIGKPDSCLN